MNLEMIGGLGLVGLMLLILAGAIVARSIQMVPQGFKYTVEYFGQYTRTLSPGLHFLIPVVERVGQKLNMKEQVLDIPSQGVITRDNAMVSVDGVTFFQVLDPAKAAYQVDELEESIIAITMTNLRTVMGSMDLDELLANRDQINARLLAVVDAATEPWGVKVTRIEIKDIAPPRDLVDSMARQMKAERDKRAQILEAEGHRAAAILKAEGEKQAVMLEAEGRKEAAFRDAEARERAAQAEAKATEMVSQAIAEGNVQAINYFVANNYVKALESLATSPNQKVLMMPLEASSIIGSLAGLAEITSEAFGGRRGGGDTTPPRPQPPARPQGGSSAGGSSAGGSSAGGSSAGGSSAGGSSAGGSSAGRGSTGASPWRQG